MLRTSAALVGGCAASLMPSPAFALARQQAPRDGAFDVKAFGAAGLRSQNATGACQAAIDACTAAGGGTVRVPPGEYSVGTIQLKDNVTLHVEAGATLFLSQDNPQFPRGRRAMVFAENASNIGVTGRGTLDGLAQYEFVAMRGVDPEIADEIAIARAAGVDMRRYYRVGVQAYMLILNDCRNVLLQDISIVHSPLWSVRLNDCDRVHVRGVSIYSDLEKGVNADGIDIVSSRNVTISDSIIETADDAIVLKAIARDGQPARPTENVTVTNCVLTSSSTALMIGTETEADIRHVLFNNCVIRNSNKGFGINVQDGATVSDVIVSNLTIETSRRHWNWWGSAEMCKFVLKKRTPDVAPRRHSRHRRRQRHRASARHQHDHRSRRTADREHPPVEHRHHHAAGERRRQARHACPPARARARRAHPRPVRALVRGRSRTEMAERAGRCGASPSSRSTASPAGRGSAARTTRRCCSTRAEHGTIRNARATDGCRRLVHVQGLATRDIAVSGCQVAGGTSAVSFEPPAVERAVRVSS